MDFDIGSSVEAVDSCGIWCGGIVAERNVDGAFLVKFDGYSHRYDRVIDNQFEIRAPTPSAISPLKRKRNQDHKVFKPCINFDLFVLVQIFLVYE